MRVRFAFIWLLVPVVVTFLLNWTFLGLIELFTKVISSFLLLNDFFYLKLKSNIFYSYCSLIHDSLLIVNLVYFDFLFKILALIDKLSVIVMQSINIIYVLLRRLFKIQEKLLYSIFVLSLILKGCLALLLEGIQFKFHFLVGLLKLGKLFLKLSYFFRMILIKLIYLGFTLNDLFIHLRIQIYNLLLIHL
jgi:hypothetical protein